MRIMNKVSFRIQGSVTRGALLASLGLLTSFSTGCGAINAVVNDPTAALDQDGATLAVVVQRADAASATATEVNRLLLETPTSVDSAWPKEVGLTNEKVTSVENELAEHPFYDGQPHHIAPVLVWAQVLPGIKGDATPAPTSSASLLAAVSAELSDGYTKLQAKVAAVGALEGRRRSEELARDKAGIPDAEKAQHDAAARSLGTQIDAAKAEVEPATKAYVEACRVAAAKVPPEVRDRFGGTLINMRQAVHDADKANSRAVFRYMILVPSVVQSPALLEKALQDDAIGNVSDIVFEQTGKRIKLTSLQPAVKFDNGKVDLSLNGIGPADLGSLQFDQVLVQTITRTGHFALEALGLLAVTSNTQYQLDFEGQVLDAIVGGFQSAGWSTPEATKIENRTAAQIHASGSLTASNAGPGLPKLFGK
jgi:hypothetical protein